MGSVGQRSDPFEQDDDLDIAISGLPGQLDDEPVEPSDAPPGGEVEFDLVLWDDAARTLAAERLTTAGIPFAWQGKSLLVSAIDEAPVANVLEIVEDETAPVLDADRDQVAYDLSDWDDDGVTLLVERLREAEIDFAWDGDELFVYGDDEEAVDELFDAVVHPDQLDAEPDEGPAGAETLGEIFVAADRLQHDAEDPDGIIGLLEVSKVVRETDPPYGVARKEWEHLSERVSSLSELLQAEEVDDEAVMTEARDLRTAVRPYV
jgi:hypothetical protein